MGDLGDRISLAFFLYVNLAYMKLCPKCEKQYDGEIASCPDDGTALLEAVAKTEGKPEALPAQEASEPDPSTADPLPAPPPAPPLKEETQKLAPPSPVPSPPSASHEQSFSFPFTYILISALILLVSVGIFYISSHKRLKMVTIEIQTQPAGALINMDGSALGPSPLITDIKKGSHHLVIELQGYQKVEEEIVINQKDLISRKLVPQNTNVP